MRLSFTGLFTKRIIQQFFHTVNLSWCDAHTEVLNDKTRVPMKIGAILYDSSKFAPVLISLHIYWTFGNAPGDSVPFTVSRRNWLFSAPKGAEISAIVYTMVEIAKAHGLNIYKYLNHLLEHLPETRMRESELSRLAPWAPEIISRCSGAM